jgi:YVTN family beta-propeller protein
MDSGDGDRAYVTCFQDGQLYVVDPRGLSTVEDIITVGRGPFSVVASPSRKKVYVTNFLEDTIAVIDTSPTSPFYNRVVLRIGDVRPL